MLLMIVQGSVSDLVEERPSAERMTWSSCLSSQKTDLGMILMPPSRGISPSRRQPSMKLLSRLGPALLGRRSGSDAVKGVDADSHSLVIFRGGSL